MQMFYDWAITQLHTLGPFTRKSLKERKIYHLWPTNICRMCSHCVLYSSSELFFASENPISRDTLSLMFKWMSTRETKSLCPLDLSIVFIFGQRGSLFFASAAFYGPLSSGYNELFLLTVSCPNIQLTVSVICLSSSQIRDLFKWQVMVCFKCIESFPPPAISLCSRSESVCVMNVTFIPK